MENFRENNIEDISLFAIYYAFQTTFVWGGIVWKLTENDLSHIRSLIDLNDNQKTGEDVWSWVHERLNNKFYTRKSMELIGSEFLQNISKYYN